MTTEESNIPHAALGNLFATRFGFKLPANEDGPREGKRGEYVESATCIIVSYKPEPSILFIRRSIRQGDPWSGQIAVPGGRIERSDPSILAGAQREAKEEVGITLSAPVGRLTNTSSPVGSGMIVAVYIFEADATQPLVFQPSEVANAFWWPISKLIAPENQAGVRALPGGYIEANIAQSTPDNFVHPAVRMPDGALLWGMTYSWIYQFLAGVGLDTGGMKPYFVRSSSN